MKRCLAGQGARLHHSQRHANLAPHQAGHPGCQQACQPAKALTAALLLVALLAPLGCGQAGSEQQALVLALASFAEKPGPDGAPVPLPASLEFLAQQPDGSWAMTTLEDPESNVFHKAMAYSDGTGATGLLTAGGTEAVMKLWKASGGKLEAATLWKKDFGGKFSRMRDVEAGDLFGDGHASLAVATHDQGVVATLRADGKGGFTVTEIDHEPNMFVHEIEIGDVNGDGTLEVYATPSEPNRLDGSVQAGFVTRYVPAKGEGRVIVADLGHRHAKEILVDDVDGDGTDELYVVVEGKTDPETNALEHGVEIRRYDADTDPKQGIVIAEIRDRLCRFLTAGDIDGDGKRELVAAAFQSGLWLLRPGADAKKRWKLSSIDRNSGGFEHAAILADLDGDSSDELYVASDKHSEVRRYVWDGKKLAREVIYKRKAGGGAFTWNVMPVPLGLVP